MPGSVLCSRAEYHPVDLRSSKGLATIPILLAREPLTCSSSAGFCQGIGSSSPWGSGCCTPFRVHSSTSGWLSCTGRLAESGGRLNLSLRSAILRTCADAESCPGRLLKARPWRTSGCQSSNTIPSKWACGKFTSVACIFRASSRVMCFCGFRDTSSNLLSKFICRIARLWAVASTYTMN